MIRTLPPVCLFVALARMLTGQLILSKHLIGSEVEVETGKTYTIFRNIKIKSDCQDIEQAWFAVSFKFARLSHKANKVASLIPMLVIAGYPGFIQKIYAVDHASGYWQGIYHWKSQMHLDAYKRSFVFRIMKKRALKHSIKYSAIQDKSLQDYLQGYSSLMIE